MELSGERPPLGQREPQAIPNGDEQSHAKRRHNDPRAFRKRAIGGDRYRDKREHDRSVGLAKRAFQPAGARSAAPLPCRQTRTWPRSRRPMRSRGPRTEQQMPAARIEGCPKRHRLPRSRRCQGGSFVRTRWRAFHRSPQMQYAPQARPAVSRTTGNGPQTGKGARPPGPSRREIST